MEMLSTSARCQCSAEKQPATFFCCDAERCSANSSLLQWKAAESACPCLQLMFDTVDTVHDCIRIATGVISTIKIFPDKMMAGLSADMLATDLAEYLVRKGECLLCTAQRTGDWQPCCSLVQAASQNGPVVTMCARIFCDCTALARGI